VTRTLKIVSVAIGLTAFMLLAVFGFAIWVFIPLLPAGIVFAIAVLTLKSRSRKRPEHTEDKDQRKAA
jgi:fatty acid desaturase